MTGGLPALDLVCIRAPNPGPLTLSGTNTWIVGRDPGWVIDPGPQIDSHLDAVATELTARGGAGGIAVTHGHGDHADGVSGLLARLGSDVPVASAAGGVGSTTLVDGAFFGPLQALSLPGHAHDHLGFILKREGLSSGFTGDAVLGEGSVFIADDMAGYLDALRRLKALQLDFIRPGHGPVVTAVSEHLDAYIAHRLERERRVLAALEQGVRTESELLEAVWGFLPERLVTPATRTLRAHLDKLRAENRVPA